MFAVKVAASVAACFALSGCFIFIPGSVVGKVSDAFTGDKGEHCVARGTKVGDRVNIGFNRIGVVEFVSETPSSRCNDPMMPMRAALAFAPQAAERPPTPSSALPLYGSLTDSTGSVCHYGNGKPEKTINTKAGESCPPFVAR